MSGVLLTKTTGGQQTLIERFSAESRRLGDTEVELAMAGRWQIASRRAALTMIPAIVYLVAGLALHGQRGISLGTAVAFTSMLNRLVSPATTLQGIGRRLLDLDGAVRPHLRGARPARRRRDKAWCASTSSVRGEVSFTTCLRLRRVRYR